MFRATYFPKENIMDNKDQKSGQPQQGGKDANRDKQPAQQGGAGKQNDGAKSDKKPEQNK